MHEAIEMAELDQRGFYPHEYPENYAKAFGGEYLLWVFSLQDGLVEALMSFGASSVSIENGASDGLAKEVMANPKPYIFSSPII